MSDPRGLPMDATDKSGAGFSIGRRRLLAYAVSSTHNSYGSGLTPTPATHYVDDVTYSLGRMP
jgi:hypothetical protein